MKLHQTSAEYALAITKPQFKVLEDKCEFDEVDKLLSDLPVDKLEYNGHFGAFFYFRVSAKERRAFTMKSAELVAIEVKDRIAALVKSRRHAKNTWEVEDEAS